MAQIGIIGLGRVGTALGILLREAGHTVAAAHDRDLASRKRFAERVADVALEEMAGVFGRTDVVIIAVPDRAIAGICDRILASGEMRPGVCIGHTSGALSSDLLERFRARGCSVFSMHPIQTFADIDSAVKAIPGTYFGIEGDPEAVELAKEMVASIGGIPVLVRRDTKLLYHAALSATSNFLVTLMGLAVALSEAAGMQREEALRIMTPLIRVTLSNFNESGIEALTGPIERGDAETLEKQLHAISNSEPGFLQLYVCLARATVRLARKKGSISDTQLELMLKILGHVDTTNSE